MRFVIAILISIALSRGLSAQVTAADITYDFESGSLDTAITQTVNDVLLRLKLDDQYGDLYGWYYFKINRNAAGQTVNFTIENPDGWVNASHKPVYSYDRENWRRIDNIWMHWGTQCFYQNFIQDSVYIALVFPYTFSEMMNDLNLFASSPFFDYEIIGQSVRGRDIPLVTISDTSFPDDEKRTCWIISRQHPMETPPSFTIKAMMGYLIGSGAPGGENMLRYLTFKIVPMVNVDGVAEGLSRHNLNGINLNRCWAYDTTYAGEEPEVNAVHTAIDGWIARGNRVDLFLDMHAAPDLYDFGFKLAASYAYQSYWEDVNTFVHHLDDNNPYQSFARWRDQTQSYGSGLSKMAMYRQHGIPGASNEHSWSQRWNGAPITINGLSFEGMLYARSIYEYLHPLDITDSRGNPVDTLYPGETIQLTVCDLDENQNPGAAEWIVAHINTASGDSETVMLVETGGATGIFTNPAPLELVQGTPFPGNDRIEVNPPERITAVYQDNDFPLDFSWAFAFAAPQQAVQYSPADCIKPANLSVYPNPFNRAAAVSFHLPSGGETTLELFDIAGRHCLTIAAGNLNQGWHSVDICADNLASGVYFARINRSGETVGVVKIIAEK